MCWLMGRFAQQRFYDPPPGTGYLRANVGDEVRILYIGATATEDEGWLYARRMSGPLDDDLECKGLLAEDSVAAATKETGSRVAPMDELACSRAWGLEAGKETWLRVGAMVCTTKALRSMVSGELCADVGDYFQVLLIGGMGTAEEGWLYGRKLRGFGEDSGKCRGWLRAQAVGPVLWEA